jgi:phenylalanyl-tRNA synthetase beta chain
LALRPSVGVGGEPAPALTDARHAHASNITVRVDVPELVNRFMGVVVRGVSVGPSPAWLVRRLEAIGARSINNVVDASNYILHELGQPTHAFDLAKLGGDSVIVRRARPGETLTTLDGATRALTDQMIVIADAERAQSVAGVMGGRDSEVTEATTDLFLEVANFDPRSIRHARRALGLSSDASYRFERGVDIEIAPRALARFAELIVAIAGGRIDGAPVDLAYERAAPAAITLRPARVARLLGDHVPTDEIAAYLCGIGFAAEPDGADLRVTVPSWRGDVRIEADLIEEVARLRGYDSFPVELRPFRPSAVGDDPRWLTSGRVRDALVGAGMLELRPMPFVPGGTDFVRVGNPLAENEAYLRRDVLDTLARRAEYNLSHMQGDLRIFEIGAAFSPRPGRLPREELRVAALVMGRRQPPHFSDPKSAAFEEWARYSEWDAKALAQHVAGVAYPGAAIVLRPSDDAAVLWDVFAEGEQVGTARRVPLDAPVWAAPAFGIEISLGVVESADVAPRGESAHRPFVRDSRPVTRYTPVPSTPASVFDLALIVPENVGADQIEALVRRVSGRLLERLELFDRYAGQGVEPGHRSLAWRLTFRHPERTLRDREIEARRSDILKALADELNVRQRSS